jgi:hypothetical protein
VNVNVHNHGCMLVVFSSAGYYGSHARNTYMKNGVQGRSERLAQHPKATVI